MTVLLYSYIILMYRAINAPSHRNSFVDGINAAFKHCLKRGMVFIGKL